MESLRERVASALVRWRYVAFALVCLTTAWGASRALRIGFDPTYRIWFPAGEPLITTYDELLDTFGADDAVVIVFTDPRGVFNNGALGVVDRLSRGLDRVSHVERVDSLTRFDVLEGTADTLVSEPLVERLPLSPSELERARRRALDDTRCRGLLVSPDGRTTQIVARVDTNEDSTRRAYEVRDEVEALLAPLRAEGGYTYWVAGNPILETEYTDAALRDVRTIGPVFAGLIVLILALVFRSVAGVVLPLLVSGAAVVVTLGVAQTLGFKLNILTTTVPQIVFAYGLSDAVHLFGALQRERAGGSDRPSATRAALAANVVPCFLTSFTTAVGFLSLTVSGVLPVRDIGLLCGIGVGVEYAVALGAFPLLASWSGRAAPTHPLSRLPFERCGALAVRRPGRALLVAACVVGVGVLGTLSLRVNSDVIGYFKERMSIRKTIDYINSHISGAADYEVIVDTGTTRGVLAPARLARIGAFSDRLAARSEFTHVLSLVDLLRRANRALHGDDPAWHRVPDTEAGVAQLLLLLETEAADGGLDAWVDFDRSKLRVSTRVRHLDTSVGLALLDTITAEARDDFGLDVRVTGKNVMFTYMQDRVSWTFIESILLALGFITLTLGLVFRSVRLPLVSLLPNVGPVVFTLGFMGVAGIDLDFGTAMVGAIALGVAVDDTVHLFAAFRANGYRPDALPVITGRLGPPMALSSLVIVAGFSVFVLSDFRLNSNFGILTAVVLSVGLACDLWVTPAALSRVYGGRERC